MHATRFVVAVLWAALATTVRCEANPAATAADRWSQLAHRFQSEYPANGPGAYVIAAKNGKIIFSRGFGHADLENSIPLTADSVVRIASLTKQFTAVAVLLLVEQKLLRLDEPLREVLRNCPTAWQPITIRQLLNQTSGLSDDLSPLYERIATDMTADQLLALYRPYPLMSKPGAKWHYSNLNYWILGKVIETVARKPYAEFVTRHVLVPGMAHTRYGSHGAIILGRAHGYEPDSKSGWVNARYFSATLGYSAGGFLSTPTDMAIWYAALGRGAVIAPRTLALALTEGRTSNSQPTGYGLGWYLSTMNGLHVAHHGGSTFGFQSCIYFVPSRSVFVGVFKNSNDARGEPDEDARALLNKTMEQ
jgi:CubicO group peptidase (beta-lactamase class C family)